MQQIKKKYNKIKKTILDSRDILSYHINIWTDNSTNFIKLKYDNKFFIFINLTFRTKIFKL